MADLVRRNPLALLVTNGPAAAGPYATHLPVIPDPEQSAEWAPDLAGAHLLGHLNRAANPHWAALETGAAALLTFTGPHAYVSPTVYGTTPAAPTWNFTAAHLHGVLNLLEPGEETLHVVQATVRAFEARFGTGWDMTDSAEYFEKLLPAVGAFRFVVSRAESMFKLSQEQQPEVRERVRVSFARSGCEWHRETAALMGKLP
jgi:transcriptional regulator